MQRLFAESSLENKVLDAIFFGKTSFVTAVRERRCYF